MSCPHSLKADCSMNNSAMRHGISFLSVTSLNNFTYEWWPILTIILLIWPFILFDAEIQRRDPHILCDHNWKRQGQNAGIPESKALFVVCTYFIYKDERLRRLLVTLVGGPCTDKLFIWWILFQPIAISRKNLQSVPHCRDFFKWSSILTSERSEIAEK